jgi:GH15 family glucan-1,4-alpha-glucosidase
VAAVGSNSAGWVAFDRAIRLAERRGRPGDVQRWTNMRSMVYRQIMERGFDTKRHAFVQPYDTDTPVPELARTAIR